jgi:uncharacterized protein (TIGR02246 family)
MKSPLSIDGEQPGKEALMFSFVSLVLMSASLLAAPPPAAAMPGKDAGVIAVADAYMAAVLKGDADAVAALYTDDAIEMPPNAAAVKGKAAIEQYYKKQFAGAKISSFTLSHLDSRTSGDMGYDVGTYAQTMTPTGGTSSFQDAGKYIVLVAKSGGKWRVRYVCYNSDNPPPPASHSH